MEPHPHKLKEEVKLLCSLTANGLDASGRRRAGRLGLLGRSGPVALLPASDYAERAWRERMLKLTKRQNTFRATRFDIQTDRAFGEPAGRYSKSVARAPTKVNTTFPFHTPKIFKSYFHFHIRPYEAPFKCSLAQPTLRIFEQKRQTLGAFMLRDVFTSAVIFIITVRRSTI
ncbi:hypothetical protein EVAR_39318_1 [Eumeta japonica]|uniref:Uncharacterized protein n=1 Tax=Eumeta variegata TaxID=151549 RepID=A0A4C1VXD0_EUMVA|nr:hypothetical protein EVAR_39318_1 [Eumeta japonica]